jgi:hypothetical protein
MISPYKLSATHSIVDFRLPIANLKEGLESFKSATGNWQSPIPWVADGRL